MYRLMTHALEDTNREKEINMFQKQRSHMFFKIGVLNSCLFQAVYIQCITLEVDVYTYLFKMNKMFFANL